jgi:hypothetical protein
MVYNVITRINEIKYRNQRHFRAKVIFVYLDRLALYLGATFNNSLEEEAV